MCVSKAGYLDLSHLSATVKRVILYSPKGWRERERAESDCPVAILFEQKGEWKGGRRERVHSKFSAQMLLLLSRERWGVANKELSPRGGWLGWRKEVWWPWGLHSAFSASHTKMEDSVRDTERSKIDLIFCHYWGVKRLRNQNALCSFDQLFSSLRRSYLRTANFLCLLCSSGIWYGENAFGAMLIIGCIGHWCRLRNAPWEGGKEEFGWSSFLAAAVKEGS